MCRQNLMARNSNRKFDSVKDILAGVLNNPKISKKLTQYAVLDLWPEIVGKALAEKTRPDRVSGETLYVEAKNAAWVQELTFMKGLILQKIREECPDSKIVDVKFFAKRTKPVW